MTALVPTILTHVEILSPNCLELGDRLDKVIMKEPIPMMGLGVL